MLIAIEGIDGSGKGTQAQLLHEAMQKDGIRSVLWGFPRYTQTTCGAMTGRYLNGEFGGLKTVSPYLAGMLFAADRFESSATLQRQMAEYDVVICDRYIASNIAHQAAKLPEEQRPDLIKWLTFLEKNLYLLPSPDMTLFLDMPVHFAATLILKKQERTYTEKKADIHEADPLYLQAVYEVYQSLSKASRWVTIDCLAFCRDVMPVEQVHRNIVNWLKHDHSNITSVWKQVRPT